MTDSDGNKLEGSTPVVESPTLQFKKNFWIHIVPDPTCSWTAERVTIFINKC